MSARSSYLFLAICSLSTALVFFFFREGAHHDWKPFYVQIVDATFITSSVFGLFGLALLAYSVVKKRKWTILALAVGVALLPIIYYGLVTCMIAYQAMKGQI